MKKYKVILADPPWQYHRNSGFGVAENHYNTMSLEDIKALPVKELSDRNSVLLLWATWPFLDQAFELVEYWGFEYKTIIPWIKIKSIDIDMFDSVPTIESQWGVGFWARGCSEPLLVCKRGNIKHPADPPLGLIERRYDDPIFLGPRLQHSRKLESVYQYAELFDGPYLELFARRQRNGWDVFGNEVESSIALPTG